MAEENTEEKKEQKKPSTLTWKIIKWLWAFFAFGFVLVFLIFILIYNGWIGYMPPVEELKNPQDKFATVVYSADG